MAKGDVQEVARKREKPDALRIAARVEASVKAMEADEAKVVAVGVTPLNAGFFRLERMRSESIAKKRERVRKKVRGK